MEFLTYPKKNQKGEIFCSEETLNHENPLKIFCSEETLNHENPYFFDKGKTLNHEKPLKEFFIRRNHKAMKNSLKNFLVRGKH